MKDKITLCFFIDALGWRIFQEHPDFLSDHLVDAKELRTILGYSSACDPSIISGKKPNEHLHWSSFYYSEKSCDYSWTKALSLLPNFVTKRSRVRHYLSRLIKYLHGYTGYFQIYQVPFKQLSYFDYAEKNRIWVPGGLNRGRTIFDEFLDHGVDYYVGDQDPEQIQVAKVQEAIKAQSIDFAYILFGRLDAVMHMNGTRGALVDETLNQLEAMIDETIRLAKRNYKDVEFYVFSDHGMHDITSVYDLQAEIAKSKLVYGKDYIAFYDSTMARFWYLKSEAKKVVLEILSSCDYGKILSDQELKDEGVYFSDGQYGETIFLLKPGALLIPSYMGLKPIPGMHGYDPEDLDSSAMIGGNVKIPEETTSIEQIYPLINITNKRTSQLAVIQ